MELDRASGRVWHWRAGGHVFLPVLAGLFVVAWVSFVAGAAFLFREVSIAPLELRRVAVMMLALLGAINVMLMSSFVLIMMVWIGLGRDRAGQRDSGKNSL